MESQRKAGPADPDERNALTDQAPPGALDRAPGLGGWLATPVIAIIAVVCCAGPLLLGALAATGAGAWLGAHGYTSGAAALIVLAALLAWQIGARMSRACDSTSFQWSAGCPVFAGMGRLVVKGRATIA